MREKKKNERETDSNGNSEAILPENEIDIDPSTPLQIENPVSFRVNLLNLYTLYGLHLFSYSLY